MSINEINVANLLNELYLFGINRANLLEIKYLNG